MVSEILVQQLTRIGETLPSALRERILAQGARAVPLLLRFLQEGEDFEESWASLHAVGLLVDLHATEAIEPLLRVLIETECIDTLHERIVERLPELGVAVLEPALALLREDKDDETLFSLCEVLCKLRFRDDRIFAALIEAFNESAFVGASYLDDYGEPRAVPFIDRAIQAFEPGRGPESTSVELAALVATRERLGGPLPDTLKAHVDQLRARLLAATGTRRR
jgi:hypothetical protein